MKKYFERLYREFDKEFEKPYYKNLPLIEAVIVMIITSRAIAEGIEIFPYSINKFLVDLAVSWSYIIAPIIDEAYRSVGYLFCPDVALIHKLPEENPTYPLCVWMPTLWLFTIIYTFTYWLIFTAITYGIGKVLGGKGTFLRLLACTGIAHIPLINWWFYVGCEMMYEIVQQEIYLSLLPPYYASVAKTKIPTPWGWLPNLIPIEGFWFGYATGIAFMILTIALMYGLVKRELKLNTLRTLMSIPHWIVYLLGFVLIGSLNINDIEMILNDYVSKGLAWKWFV